MPNPGTLRFCGDGCHDGWREDRRYGLLTLPQDFADAGCCMYCGHYVPTNEEMRLARLVAAAHEQTNLYHLWAPRAVRAVTTHERSLSGQLIARELCNLYARSTN